MVKGEKQNDNSCLSTLHVAFIFYGKTSEEFKRCLHFFPVNKNKAFIFFFI